MYTSARMGIRGKTKLRPSAPQKARSIHVPPCQRGCRPHSRRRRRATKWRTRRGRDGDRPEREYLRRRRREARPRQRRPDVHRHRVRHLLMHEGDNGRRRHAARGGGGNIPRRSSEGVRAGTRRHSSSRRLRRQWRAANPRPEVRRHHRAAHAPHGWIRLRFLQPRPHKLRREARRPERRVGDPGFARLGPPLRPRRAMGVRLEHRLGRQSRRGRARQTPRRSDERAHLRAARNGQRGLHDDRRGGLSPRLHAPKRRRRFAHPALGFRARSKPRAAHGRPRTIHARRRLYEVCPSATI